MSLNYNLYSFDLRHFSHFKATNKVILDSIQNLYPTFLVHRDRMQNFQSLIEKKVINCDMSAVSRKGSHTQTNFQSALRCNFAFAFQRWMSPLLFCIAFQC